MLRSWNREAEVLRYHRSKGALGAKERVEQRKHGTAERAGPDKDKAGWAEPGEDQAG